MKVSCQASHSVTVLVMYGEMHCRNSRGKSTLAYSSRVQEMMNIAIRPTSFVVVVILVLLFCP